MTKFILEHLEYSPSEQRRLNERWFWRLCSINVDSNVSTNRGQWGDNERGRVSAIRTLRSCIADANGDNRFLHEDYYTYTPAPLPTTRQAETPVDQPTHRNIVSNISVRRVRLDDEGNIAERGENLLDENNNA